MANVKSIYSADFETTTKPDDCRVWAWGYSNIEEPELVKLGNTIDTFMDDLKENGGIYYFHNLKFDGNFIIYWLFTHRYIWVSKKAKDLEPGEFTTLISGMGTWYTITIRMFPKMTGEAHVVELRDSAKLIPLPVADIPKAYGLEESKLHIDYYEDRPIGHELTDAEIAYIRADIIIVAKAIKFMREHGQIKLTAASNALYDFKKRYDKKEYNKLFPALNSIADADIRRSYKGGWTYLNPKYANKDIAVGTVYDVNSMYPWAMKYCLLPYGEPYIFSGKYKPSKNYPLYVQCLVAEFELKPGKFPSIQVKEPKSPYAPNEYITKSIMPTVLTLTNVDLELFFENYNIIGSIEYLGGYMFRGRHGLFTEYIDYWYEEKTEGKRTGNKGWEKIAKLMLNSLYGKFGARIHGRSKIPFYDATLDKVRYKLSDDEERKGVYLPIATFITSYCRDKIIRGANICGDRFIYGDTDSLHILGNEPVEGLEIDEYKLGAFKCEEIFIRGRFIRQKTYLEVYQEENKKTGKLEDKLNIKCCGMPDSVKRAITEDDFRDGAVFDDEFIARKNREKLLQNPDTEYRDLFQQKLMPKVVTGGVILEETSFQIKSREKGKRYTEQTLTEYGMFVRDIIMKTDKPHTVPEFTIM